MRHGIPQIYWTFRYAWSGVHVALLVVLTAWLVTYLVTDGRGEELYNEWWTWAQEIRNTLANLVPFPWS